MPIRKLRSISGAAAVLMLLCSVAPSIAGPPFVTDDPVPPEYHTWEVNYALTGTHASGANMASLPSVDINYGGAPGVQLHLQAQMAYIKTDSARAFGLGDTEIGIKYRLTEATGETDDWAIGVYPIYRIPTGSARRQLGAGESSLYLPLWVQTRWGHWTSFGGGGYSLNAGAGRRNTWSAGWATLYQFDEGLQLGGEIYARTADTPDGLNSTGFNLGGIRELSKTCNLLFSAGRGFGAASSENQVSFYVGLQVVY